jgi:hypothetical protein
MTKEDLRKEIEKIFETYSVTDETEKEVIDEFWDDFNKFDESDRYDLHEDFTGDMDEFIHYGFTNENEFYYSLSIDRDFGNLKIL